MSLVMEQIRELADIIGPRPATTDAESRAADHIEDTMRAYGVDVERQEFDCPRSDGRPTIVHGLLLIGAAVLAMWWSIPALVLAVLATALIWLDAAGRPVLSRYLGSGPSQNIIGRHVPRARRNERLQRVVIVAHYDTARPSFLTSPGFVRHLGTVAVLMRWIPAGVTIWIALTALPLAASWKPWAGYVAVVGAAVMLLPVAAAVQKELFSQAIDGANDNASGVAAMLAVMAATVPGAPESQQRVPLRRGQEAVEEAGELDEDVVLEYRPMALAVSEEQLPMGIDDLGGEDLWTAGIDVATQDEPVGAGGSARSRSEAYNYREDERAGLDDTGPGWDLEEAVPGQVSIDMGFEDESIPGPVAEVPEPEGSAEEPSGRRRRSRSRRERDDEEDGRGLRDWLGIGRGFEVRRAGKEIGSWENLDDDDEFGFKAGTAGEAGPGDFADPSAIAARIRRQVTEGVDRALAEKEIWFVATGAKEAGGWGMRALLDAYGDDLQEAMFINIDTVGAGGLTFILREGGASTYRADRRLVAQAKRTARENDLPVKGREHTGIVSDATVALSRGHRAMSVMAFDINGRLPNWHWHTDTIDAVSESTVEQAVQFVTALVRDL